MKVMRRTNGNWERTNRCSRRILPKAVQTLTRSGQEKNRRQNVQLQKRGCQPGIRTFTRD